MELNGMEFSWMQMQSYTIIAQPVYVVFLFVSFISIIVIFVHFFA